MDQIEVNNLLASDLGDASHLELIHERITMFRWLVIFEIILFLLCLPCIIPLLAVVLVVAVVTGATMELEAGEDIKHRFFYFKHQLTLVAVNRDGEIIHQASWIPGSEAEADNFISDLLVSISEKQLVLVESLGGNLREHLCNWYGGKPFLAMVSDHAETDSIQSLKQQGFLIDVNDTSIEMTHTEEGVGSAGAIIMLIAVVVAIFLFPFCLLGLFSGSIRRFLKETTLTAMGVDPAQWKLLIKAEQIRLTRKRRDSEVVHLDIDGRDIIGMSFAAGYGFDREVVYKNKMLRVVCTSKTHVFPSWANEVGDHLLELLISASLRLRSEQPELGLAFDKERPSKCPYCTSIYVFKPGMNCPSCGGWPDKCS